MNNFIKHICMFGLFFALITLASAALSCVDSFSEPNIVSSLPFENRIAPLRKALTGPFAFTICIIIVLLTGSILLFNVDDYGSTHTAVSKNEEKEFTLKNQVEWCYCEHCGTELIGNRCESCGAPKRKT